MHKIKLKIYLSLIAVVFAPGLSGQGVLKGTVTDAGSGNATETAAVVIDKKKGTPTDGNGNFIISQLSEGQHHVTVSMLGYKQWDSEISIADNDTLFLNVVLELSSVEVGEVVVSATRTQNLITNVPARVNVVSPEEVQAIPALTTDDYLALVPGLNISRSFGIFSHKANVTMRGLSGKDQSRVLVMIDGIPVNKADGGSVNWNLLDPDIIDHIEIVKGPASAVYGSNAMGGAINIITCKPSSGFNGKISAGYGTYNTVTGRVNISHRFGKSTGRGLYYSLNGFHRQSEGYITQSLYDQQANPYIVPSNVWELSGDLKMGYDFSTGKSLEVDLTAYNDERGTGEKVYKPNGNTTDHDTYQARARYKNSGDRITTDLSLYWLLENYKKVNEYKKDDYTWYDVLSKRTDAGILSSVTYNAAENHSVTAGVDLKVGSVDAYDMYYTSTDIVYNKGSIFTTGVYIQDEMSLVEKKLRIIAGLRFDLAKFYDGAFYIESPSAETAFMSGIVDRNMEDAVWNAVSPRLSANYKINENIRLYAAAGRGFRPSVLDDLCRSGRMKGGFKLANPEVVPESLVNFETGGDIRFNEKVKASLSAYYSIGTNFLYYVNTGDSIELSYGLRPVYVSTNIPEVRIGGVEAEASYIINQELTLTGSYSYSHSLITRYTPLDNSDPIDLTGKFLTDVPSHIASLMARWTNRFVNTSITGRYQSSMWVNDMNVYDDVVGSARYNSYLTCDVQLSKDIKILILSLGVQNILDTKFYDSSGAVCPGRFITIEAGLKF